MSFVKVTANFGANRNAEGVYEETTPGRWDQISPANSYFFEWDGLDTWNLKLGVSSVAIDDGSGNSSSPTTSAWVDYRVEVISSPGEIPGAGAVVPVSPGQLPPSPGGGAVVTSPGSIDPQSAGTPASPGAVNPQAPGPVLNPEGYVWTTVQNLDQGQRDQVLQNLGISGGVNQNVIYGLVAGQSNMMGRSGTSTKGYSKAPDPNVEIWNYATQAWEVWDLEANPSQLANPEQPAPGVGGSPTIGSYSMAFSGAKRIAEATGAKVRIMAAVEGGQLISRWVPSSSAYWQYILAQTAAANVPGYAFFWWHQGESDFSRTYAAYKADLETLITQVRSLPEGIEAKIAFGELLDDATYGRMNAVYDEFQGQHEVAVISARGRARAGDNIHFTGDSLVELGWDFAGAYLGGSSQAASASRPGHRSLNGGLSPGIEFRESGSAHLPGVKISTSVRAGIKVDGAYEVAITGRPNIVATSSTLENSALYLDNGATGHFELGQITGTSGVFARGRTGQQVTVDCAGIKIGSSGFHACVHAGSSSSSTELHFKAPFVINTQSQQYASCFYAAGSGTTLFADVGKVSSNVTGAARGVINTASSAKMFLKSQSIEGTNATGVLIEHQGASLEIECPNIRAEGNFIRIGGTSPTLRLTSGTIFIGASFFSSSSGTLNLIIEGEVRSNVALPGSGVNLVSGTWTTDPSVT